MTPDYICFRSAETDEDASLSESYTIFGASSREDARSLFAAGKETEGYSAELSDTSEEVFLRKGGTETVYYGFDEA